MRYDVCTIVTSRNPRSAVKTILLTTAILLMGSAQPMAARVAASAADETAIRAVQTRQAEAWNNHDAIAYAHLFTQEGDVVNVVGWWWKGRAAIESKLTAAFSFVFRDSTLTITSVDIDFPAPAIALAHVRWTMSGANTPQGMPEPREGIQLQVLKKSDGAWLIETLQNTLTIPERPFPTSAPAP